MKIGFLSEFDRERIAFARKHGFGSVELVAPAGTDYLPGNDGWKDKATAVKSAYDEAALRISCIGGFYTNHLDADPAKAKQQAEQVRHVITLAVHMQVPVVGGFAGRVMNRPLEASIEPFTKVWSEHAKFAEDHGVKIAFEHCPMGQYHAPIGAGSNNCVSTPAMWARLFNAVPSDALGLEWDASHLVCQFIDPVLNLRTWGRKVHHVHAKDAKVYWDVAAKYGIYHDGAIEHCFPGLGDSDWAAIVKELRRAGYHGDLNIEGWHDAVFRDPKDKAPEDVAAQAGSGPQPALEDVGLLISLRHLSQFTD